MRLNLQKDRPEQYQGRELELHGVKYRIGKRLEHGRDWQTHLLVNVRSQVALHQVQLPKSPHQRQTMVKLTVPPPRPTRGSITLSTTAGPIILHPLTRHHDVDRNTAAAWADTPHQGRVAERIKRYQDILNQHPHHVPTRLALGEMAAERGAWLQAVQLAAEAIDTEPNWLPCQLLYLRCCLALARPRMAVMAHQRLRALFPAEAPHPDVVPMMLALGDIKAARQVVDALGEDDRGSLAAQVADDEAAAQATAASIEEAFQALSNGHDQEAFDRLHVAWQQYPRGPWVRFNMALALWRVGRPYLAWAVMRPALYLVPIEFLPVLGLHLAALAIDIGWLPNALALLGGCPLPSAVPRLRWKDDERTLAESSPRQFRLRLQELLSAAMRMKVELHPPLPHLLGVYGLGPRPVQFLAGEYQVEKVLGPRTVEARNAVSGVRAILRFTDPPNLPRHRNLLLPRYRRQAGRAVAWVYEHPTEGTLAENPPPGPLVAQKMASALQACHGHGLYHGCLDAHHVVLCDDGEPRLAWPSEPVEGASQAGDVQAWQTLFPEESWLGSVDSVEPLPPRPATALELAQSCIDDADLVGAMQYLDSDDPAILTLRSIVLRLSGDPDAALEAARKAGAGEALADLVPPDEALTLLTGERRALLQYQIGQTPQEPMSSALRAVVSDNLEALDSLSLPHHLETWLLFGRLMVCAAERQRTVEKARYLWGHAAEAWRKVVVEFGFSAFAPQLADALLETGLLLLKLNESPAAVRHLHVAVALWRNLSENLAGWTRLKLAQVHIAMARALAAEGCLDVAADSLNEARDIFTKHPPLPAARAALAASTAVALRQSGQVEVAVRQCQEGLSLEGVPLDRQAELWEVLATCGDAEARQKAVACWRELGGVRGQREADALGAPEVTSLH
ncbi:MAG TPA: hypothetical protein VGO93_07320 [Candidatus Xenobia bacterium]